MRRAFADTFYWATLTLPREPHHAMALELSDEFKGAGQITTTEEILVEYLNHMSKLGGYWREQAVKAVDEAQRSRAVVIVGQSSESFGNGLRLYAARQDKGYSLTDCISMQTMRTLGIVDVLTHDRHFEQEGFRAMFRVH